MNQKEKELFKKLCSFKSDSFDKELLEAATPAVLGYLFFNRMQAIAYGMLNRFGLAEGVNREFRNSLKAAYLQNIEKNRSFFSCVEYLFSLLSELENPYAFLKGAYLCRLYPEGYRTSNDIDLLVLPKDVTKIGEILLNAGFKQGKIKGGAFIPALRKEIIESRMLRGETVPFVKRVELPGMQFLEVDINFSVDCKPEESDLVSRMLYYTAVRENADYRVRTLRKDDFFVHLCAHLYKEAAMLPWVEMKRDMTLYKYCDIYTLLNGISKENVDFLFDRAKLLNMEKICAFAVYQTAALFEFDNAYAIRLSEAILGSDPDFVHTIVSPKDKKKFIFTEKDILNRFFSDNRKELLREVI